MRSKLIYLLLLAVSFIAMTGCSDDYLETAPTTLIAGDGMLGNATNAMAPLNGIYRYMYTQGWSTTANTQQCDGIIAWNLAADVMGEDNVMKATGSGWYWFDAVYNVKSRYTSSAWRPYDLWNGFYILIANANQIIDAESTMEGDKSDVNYVVGQAYAIRAYCYHYLAMWFARTYIGHEEEPGVPLYTEPTVAGTEGKPRASLREVYAQVKQDIDKAITLLNDVPSQKDKTHIDYYVANGIKARICLTTNEWSEAAAAAKIARSNYTIGTGTTLTSGMNDAGKENVMWGATVISTQTPGWGPFLYHMDAFTILDYDGATQVYAYRALKAINKLLYEKMGENDIRRQWWQPDNDRIKSGNTVLSNYIQVKFRFSDPSTSLGDKLWMRVEEMYLTEAEAECRMGNEAAAKELLSELVTSRDPNYTVTKTGTAMGALTSDETGSLLEEIIIQRRIELWGEYGRLYDIKRLKQGFKRTEEMGWPTSALLKRYKKDIFFADFDYEFLYDLESFLLAMNYNRNTISKHMKHLKRYLNLAINQNVFEIQKDPFRQYKMKYQESRRIHLTREELYRVESLNLENHRMLIKCRDMFLFSCYTGLRFSDVVRINKENFSIIDKKIWLIYSSVKTNVNVRLPLSLLFDGKAITIYNKYKGKTDTLFDISVLSNSNVNKQLHKICQLARISKRVSFHSARHTNATLLLYDGANITTVQKLLGHKNVQTTQIYSNIMDMTIVRDLEKIGKKRVR